MLNPDKNIDRRTCRRVVPLEVLNVGPPRTGTLSMAEAYRMLGYQNPYHFASILENAKDSDMWQEALDAKFNNPTGTKKQYGRAEFDMLLGDTAAVTDTPCMIFWKELIEAYPEAKVVLVERDEEKWLASTKVLIDGTMNPILCYVLRYTDPSITGRMLGLGLTWTRYWFGVSGFMTASKVMQNARRTYRNHYADIRAGVPKEKVLGFRLSDGWEPLCKFLGKEVPDEPFPHRNDATALNKAFEMFLKGALVRSLKNLALVSVVGLVLVGMFKYRL